MGTVIVLRAPFVVPITVQPLAAAAVTLGTLITRLTFNKYDDQAALVYVRIKSGAVAPVAGGTYEVYLCRNDGTIGDQSGGTGALAIENSPLLGSIVVTADANKNFYGVFDTAPLGPLGVSWTLAIRNNTSQAISTTESDHAVRATLYSPQ